MNFNVNGVLWYDICRTFRFNLTRSLMRHNFAEPGDDARLMSLIVDMKRESPTVPTHRNIVEFSSVGQFGQLLASVNVDALLVNTEEHEYRGSLSDLKECTTALKQQVAEAATAAKVAAPPPSCILKDIILHPIQIAQALENGASGVLLNVGVVGSQLEVSGRI